MLDCAHDENGRRAAIRWLDPLLEQYDSEYHYLFARVYRAATETGPRRLEENYVLPNMARRMLEAFLAFRQPQASGELWQKVQEVPFAEAKKLRILRFLHTHSHSSAVGEPEHDPSALAEGPAVLRDLLELIKSQDEAHYEAMVKLLAPVADSGEDGGG
jgi:wobble nucleotide-excising tRNase